MFDSQPLDFVICSNYIDYNVILLIFNGDVLINFYPLPHVPIGPHCGDPSPRVATSLMDNPLGDWEVKIIRWIIET